MTTTATKGMPLDLKFPSLSDGRKKYAVTTHEDGVISCSCPAWRFQKLPPAKRTCKHLKLALALFAESLS